MKKSESSCRFPFTCTIDVRYADVDAMNHVNNAVYVTYLEIARTRLWQQRIAATASARDIPFIVARVAVDFRSSIGFEDEVRAEVAVARIGRTSFTLAYRIIASGRLAAEGETVQVAYDYAADKPMPIDDDLRARLLALQT